MTGPTGEKREGVVSYEHETPRGTPEGWHRIKLAEVYRNPNTGALVVTGVPTEAHNCDEMGCGSVSAHVVIRAWKDDREDSGKVLVDRKTLHDDIVRALMDYGLRKENADWSARIIVAALTSSPGEGAANG